MHRLVFTPILAVFAVTAASAGPLNLNPPGLLGHGAGAPTSGQIPAPLRADATPVQPVNAQGPDFGGGFLGLLFGGPGRHNGAPRYEPDRTMMPQNDHQPASYRQQIDPADEGQSFQPGRPAVNPRFMKQVVGYGGNEKPGTVIINTNERLLYLVQEDGTAIRYGIGVGRPGFAWAGVHHVTRKREWPDWTPPPEMLKRRPDLPRHMEGGPDNPLGARAMYLGSTLYRIHGSNEPWTIGQAVSSGCIRMRNEDVIDLYSKVKVGTKVVVI
jgi:lipoprotein-anchoring transpeptidase ErfK/SrfK